MLQTCQRQDYYQLCIAIALPLLHSECTCQLAGDATPCLDNDDDERRTVVQPGSPNVQRAHVTSVGDKMPSQSLVTAHLPSAISDARAKSAFHLQPINH